MASLLHIAVSPLNEASFSARVAAAFEESWRQANPEGTIDHFNLWAEPLPPFDAVGATWKLKTMAGQQIDKGEQALFEKVKAVTERFMAADRYLFSVPMWNFHIPYPLKHFIDVIVQPGLTFAFDPVSGFSGLVPSERPVQVIFSRGNAGYVPGGFMDGWDYQEPYMRGILKFIGLTDVRVIKVEGTAYGPQVAEPALEKGIIEAKAAALTL